MFKFFLRTIFFISFIMLNLPINAIADVSLKDINKYLEPLFNQGKHDAVIAESEKLLNFLPLSETEARMGCYLFLADSYFSKNEKEKAYKYLAIATEIAPKNMAPYYMAAHLKIKEGKGKEAYDQCLEDAHNLDIVQGRALIKSCLDIILKSRKIEGYKLWQEFKENEGAASDAYASRLLSVRADVLSISDPNGGSIEVLFGVGAANDGGIKCTFPESAAKNPNLAKGRVLVVSGLCMGMVEQKYILFTGCAIVK